MATDVDNPLINKPNPTPKAEETNLCPRLIAALSDTRVAGQLIRATRVTDTNYRVNWLAIAPKTTSGIDMNTYRIVKSKFYHVVEINDQLQITDRTR